MHAAREPRRLPLAPCLSAEKMEEICSSLFGPTAIADHKVRPNFINGSDENSAVLTVAMLLARNVFHIGGTVAVPQKGRLTQTGKLMCVSVCVRQCVTSKLHVANRRKPTKTNKCVFLTLRFPPQHLN